jgi:hypothetical protein
VIEIVTATVAFATEMIAGTFVIAMTVDFIMNMTSADSIVPIGGGMDLSGFTGMAIAGAVRDGRC